jgi:hypothetical protein
MQDINNEVYAMASKLLWHWQWLWGQAWWWGGREWYDAISKTIRAKHHEDKKESK